MLLDLFSPASIPESLVKAAAENRKVHTEEPDLPGRPGSESEQQAKGLMFKQLWKNPVNCPSDTWLSAKKSCRVKLERQ